MFVHIVTRFPELNGFQGCYKISYVAKATFEYINKQFQVIIYVCVQFEGCHYVLSQEKCVAVTLSVYYLIVRGRYLQTHCQSRVIKILIKYKQCTVNSTEFYIICILAQTNRRKPLYYTTIAPYKYI